MASVQDNVAINVESKADVTGLRQAQASTSALSDAAQQTRQELDIFNRVMKETGNDMQAAGRAVLAFRNEQQGLTTATEQSTTAIQQQTIAIREEAEAFGEEQGTGLVAGTRRAQSAFVGVVFAADAFTRSMNSGEGAMRRALRAIDLLAFSLGPVWGVAVTLATGLFDAFTDAMLKNAKAAEKAKAALDAELATLGRQEEGGFAKLFELRGEAQLKIQAMTQQLEAINATVAQLNKTTAYGLLATRDQRIERDKALSTQHDLLKALGTEIQMYNEIEPKYQHALQQEQNVAAFRQKEWADQDARRRQRQGEPTVTPLTDLAKGAKELMDHLSLIANDPRVMSYYQMLQGEELELSIRLNNTNLTYRERLELLGQLRKVREEEAAQFQVSTKGLSVRAAQLPALTEAEQAIIAEQTKKLDFKTAITDTVAYGLSGALANGIIAGFNHPGVKNAWAAASKAFLAGFGGLMMDMGEQYLAFSGIMKTFAAWLFVPATAGWAAAGIGVALIALGAALQGVASRSAGGAGAGSYSTSFVPTNTNAGGGITLIVQTVDPFSRSVVNNTVYEINRAGMLNTPVVAPYGRPS
ncbi:MAG TPA: hypothetical protein VH439_17340 [Gemmatimonadales bacterium]|jgi:hypothetical protein